MENIDLLNHVKEQLETTKKELTRIETLKDFTYDVSQYFEKNTNDRIGTVLIEKIRSELYGIKYMLDENIKGLSSKESDLENHFDNMERVLKAKPLSDEELNGNSDNQDNQLPF